MSDNPEARTPDGGEEAEAVEVGEPDRLDPDREPPLGDEARPNLDARERGIPTTRRPPGPPLRESADRGDSLADESPPESTEGPTDPE